MRRSTCALYLLLIAVLCVVTCTPSNKFFVWNHSDGHAVVILEGGIVKPLETMWVGYAAYDNVEDVARLITKAIASGKVPYIQSYHFGDNGLRGDFHKAVQFDTRIAQAIGNHVAFVNLETEWDVPDVIHIMQTPAGVQSFKDRVHAFRTLAPNTRLLSSPGLWSPDSTYKFFSGVDSLLDIRGNLVHVTSNTNECARRVDGTLWTSGISYDKAMETTEKLKDLRSKMSSIWGNPSKPWMTGDFGITSCGWGDEARARIVDSIVAQFDCLYELGWRGGNIRNTYPESYERAMGDKNEVMMMFSNSPATKNSVLRGYHKAIELMRSGPSTSCPTQTNFKISQASSSEWWVQFEIEPNRDISSVEMKFGSVVLPLTKTQYGSWTAAPPQKVEPGTRVTLSITSSGNVVDTVIKYLSAESVASPVSAPVSAPTPAPASGAYKITKTGSNEYWVQIQIEPTDASSVTFTYLGKKLSLTNQWVSHWIGSPPTRIPTGSKVQIDIQKANGSTVSQSIVW